MLDPRTLADPSSDAEETARFARMTPEERLELFLQLCDPTDAIVRGRPDAPALRAATPRSPESEALWARLMEHGRRGARPTIASPRSSLGSSRCSRRAA